MDSWSYIILGVFIVSYLFNLYPKTEPDAECQLVMKKKYHHEIQRKSFLLQNLLMQLKRL